MGSFAALDFGTWATKLAMSDPHGNPELVKTESGEPSLPTALIRDGTVWIVGSEALSAGVLRPKELIVCPKRHLGTDKVLLTLGDGTEIRSEDCARVVVEYVKTLYAAAAGDVLSEISITVPQNFPGVARGSLKKVVTEAGLSVVGIFTEPIAAFFGVDGPNRGPGTYQVLDLGGGTFDVSVVEVKKSGDVEVKFAGGVHDLGGVDFSKALEALVLDRFEKEHGFRPTLEEEPLCFQQLKPELERAKARFASSPEVAVCVIAGGKATSVRVSEGDYRAACTQLLDQAVSCTLETLEKAGVAHKDIREFIPVGGGSKLRFFREAIERATGKPVTTHTDSLHSVVKGAFVLGRMAIEKTGRVFAPRGVALPPIEARAVTDCTANPVSILVDLKGNLIAEELFPAGQPVPCERSLVFKLRDPGATSARIVVVEAKGGTSEADCAPIGELKLDNLPAIYDRPHAVELRSSWNQDGLLTVTAKDRESGGSATATLDPTGANP